MIPRKSMTKTILIYALPSRLQQAAEKGDAATVRSILIRLFKLEAVEALLNRLLTYDLETHHKTKSASVTCHTEAIEEVQRKKCLLALLQVAAKVGDATVVKEVVGIMCNNDIVGAVLDILPEAELRNDRSQTTIVDLVLYHINRGENRFKDSARSPLFLAAEQGHADVVDFLLCHRVIAFEDCFHMTPLHIAAENGHAKVVDVFLTFNDRLRMEFGDEVLGEHEDIFNIGLYDFDRRQFYNNRNGNQLKAVLQFECLRTNRPNYNGCNPFLTAVKFIQQKVVELLIDKGQLFGHSFDEEGETALHIMIKRINTDEYPLILKRSRDGKHYKKSQLYLELIKLLVVSKYVNVNALNFAARTALHLAMKSCRFCLNDEESNEPNSKQVVCTRVNEGKLKKEKMMNIICVKPEPLNRLVMLLLENGANVNQTNSEGKTPLMVASRRGCCHFVQVLLNWQEKSGIKILFDLRDIKGETALIKAAANNHTQMVKLLIHNGASVNVQDNHGFTALHRAIYCPDEVWADFFYFRNKFFKKMIESISAEERHDMSIEIESIEMDEEIYYIVGLEDTKEVEILNTCNDIENRRHHDLTAKEHIVKIILAASGLSGVNATDFKGRTSLDLAAFSSLTTNPETVEALKSAGGYLKKAKQSGIKRTGSTDPYTITDSFRDTRQRTALHRFAMGSPAYDYSESKRRYQEIMEYIIRTMEKIIKSNEINFEAIASARDDKGRTPLHYAIISQNDIEYSMSSYAIEDLNKSILGLILCSGVEVNTTDKYGKTLLHYPKRSDIYDWLVHHGAKDDVKDNYGKTPRDLKPLRESSVPWTLNLYSGLSNDDAENGREDQNVAIGENARIKRIHEKINEKMQHSIERIANAKKKKVPTATLR